MMLALFALLALLGSSTAQDPDSYIASVVQQMQTTKGTPEESKMATAKTFVAFVEQATKNGSQIIVFPELSLGASYVDRSKCIRYGETYPNVMNTSFVPCHASSSFRNSRPALTFLSCLARQHATYMVYGAVDIQPCQPGKNGCPKDGWKVYNMAAVLDDNGALIQKYWKEHIVLDTAGVFNTPAAPQVRTFNTSFGVRFGLFICFDIMWHHPTIDLVEMGVQHIAFPTSWVNLPPMITSLQVQQGFSATHNLNLLAANDAAAPGTSGSGLYSSGTVLASFFSTKLRGFDDQKLLIAKLPKHPQKRTTNSQLLPNGNSSSTASSIDTPKEVATSSSLSVTKPVTHPTNTMRAVAQKPTNKTAGHYCGAGKSSCEYFHPGPGKSGSLSVSLPERPGFTCHLQYNTTAGNGKQRFALAAVDIEVTFGQSWRMHMLSCGVQMCYDDLICILAVPGVPQMKLYDSLAVFSELKLSVSGGFNTTDDQFIMGFLATSGGHVLNSTAHQWTTKGDSAQMHVVGVSEPLMDASLLQRLWYSPPKKR